MSNQQMICRMAFLFALRRIPSAKFVLTQVTVMGKELR